MPLGPFVGAVTPASVKIWFRPDETETCRAQLSMDPDFSTIIAEQEQIPDDVGICLFTLDGLEPNQRYFHRIVDRAGTASDQPASFRTFPPEAESADLTFALHSCDRPFIERCWLGPIPLGDLAKRFATRCEERPRENADGMWDRLGKLLQQSQGGPEEIRFHLAVGDQVYTDILWDDPETWKILSNPDTAQAERFEAYRAIYERSWRRSAPARVWQNLPTFRIWDDHEIRDGWGSHFDQDVPAVQHMFQAAEKAYHAYQDLMNPVSLRSGERYYSFAYGTACFLVLDLRGHRNRVRQCYPVLGPQQWADIEAFIAQFPGRYQSLFVVTSIPMVHVTSCLADAGEFLFLRLVGLYDDLADQWSARHNAPEALRLLDLLFDLANRRDVRVVFLGGDAHVGTISTIRSCRRKHERHPVIYQLTASPISNAPAPIFRKITDIIGREVNLGEQSPFTGRLLGIEPERNIGLVHASGGSREASNVVFELVLESGRRLRFPTAW